MADRKRKANATIHEDKELDGIDAKKARGSNEVIEEAPESTRRSGRGHPRRTSEISTPSSATSRRSSGRGSFLVVSFSKCLVSAGARKKTRYEIDDYIPKEAGDRVLSCGEGEQLGLANITINSFYFSRTSRSLSD